MHASRALAFARAHAWELAAAGAGLFVAGFVACVLTGFGGPGFTVRLDDLGETGAALAAAAVCAFAAVRYHGRHRLAWALMAAATLAWGLGQVAWDWYELVQGTTVPFPSPADAGFLIEVPLALAAVLSFPIAFKRPGVHIRNVLDGLIIAAALLVVSWATVLGAVYRAGSDTTLGTVLGLAYPISDVVIFSVILLRVGRVSRSDRFPLLLVAGGLALLAVADSSFAYLTAQGTFATGNVLDAGWVAGFLMVALGALRAVLRPVHEAVPQPRISRRLLLIPYPPVLVALGVTIVEKVASGSLTNFTFWAALSMAALVLIRQYLVVIDNAELVGNLAAREQELAYQAEHDALTGLPNRKVFRDRVERSLRHGDDPQSRPAVLFIDLDDFKSVNDTLGHGVGDRVLTLVAERLRGCLRPSDVAARLGGDEFAVLVENTHSPAHAGVVAERILHALRQPVALHGAELPARGTIGVAIAGTDDSCDELLRRADVAMYAAKRDGKDRFEIYSDLAA